MWLYAEQKYLEIKYPFTMTQLIFTACFQAQWLKLVTRLDFSSTYFDSFETVFLLQT